MEHSTLVMEYIESVWNQGSIEALHRLTIPGFSYHFGGQPARDRPGMEDFIAATRRAFPDWRVIASNVVSEGNHVAVRWDGRVTHQGDFHGIPATGKQISVSGINLYEVVEGRIGTEWEQMDTLGMLRQLGIGG